MTIFPRPSEWARSAAGKSDRLKPVSRDHHYFAFLSYSHRDEAVARWLHEELENFRVPSAFVGKLTDHGPVPRRLTPVFRDLKELPASNDLGTEIREAIAGSRFLIVLCSPAAAASRWTNAEIEAFKKARPEGCVLAAIIEGEPFASEIPGREQEECLPPALRWHYDARGRRTRKRIEPLAADLSIDGEARRVGFLKLVAGMLGLGLDDLVQRETLRRHRRLGLIAAGSLAGMVVASGLAVAAIQARNEAYDQRREAESLVGFMLGDLRTKLEPIGRLDALDGVGRRVLGYYQQQEMSRLPDASLLQRSRALTLMGEVARLRGQLDASQQLYSAAMAGTAEVIRREPNDPQRLFEHAQTAFHLFELARQRGRPDEAEAAIRLYERLAARMVALDADNMRWRMEAQYADANLGILLLEQRRFGQAAQQFKQALATIEALANADPGNAEYRKSVAEGLAWLADAQSAGGDLKGALATRGRQIQMLRQMLAATPRDTQLQQMLIPAHQARGLILQSLSQTDPALVEFGNSVQQGDLLVPLEPSNSLWNSLLASTRLNYAEALFAADRRDEARAQTSAACRTFEALLERDQSVARWRTGRSDCLRVQALIAFGSGDHEQAKTLARQALASALSVNGGDRVSAVYRVAAIRRLSGDIYRASGDPQRARAQWRSALEFLPGDVRERPHETAERAALLQRLGRNSELKPLAQRLKNIGYRRIA